MTRVGRTAKKATIPAAQVFAEARKRPGYAEAYDALEEEFSLVTALIKARTNSGLTQAELAKRMNTTQAVIARLEAGGRRPSTRTLERLARATGHRLEISFVPESSKPQRRASR
jgi:ribosome-binding protein aMBF1 (putative translation factor)